MILALAGAGAVAMFVAWRLVATGRVSVWVAITSVASILGAASLATGRLLLSGRVPAWTAGLAGGGARGALYLATVAGGIVVRRWPACCATSGGRASWWRSRREALGRTAGDEHLHPLLGPLGAGARHVLSPGGPDHLRAAPHARGVRVPARAALGHHFPELREGP